MKKKYLVFNTFALLCFVLISNYATSQNNWVETGLSNELADIDKFASSVSLNKEGNIIAIGDMSEDEVAANTGQVRVYQKIDANWVQLGQNINGENSADFSGISVSLSDDGLTVAIGSEDNSDVANESGHVRVFTLINDNWEQLGNDIDGEEDFDYLGRSLSLSADGTILAVGAAQNDNPSLNKSAAGKVRIFQYNGTDWLQIGDSLRGEEISENFGTSVALNDAGSIIAIGNRGGVEPDPDNSNEVIAILEKVSIYEYINDEWTPLGSSIQVDDFSTFFGRDIELNSAGDILAIGASQSNINGLDSGYTEVYQYNGTDWITLGEKIVGEAAQDLSGTSISLSNNGNILAIGAPRNIGNGTVVFKYGHVRVFEYEDNAWSQIGEDIDGDFNIGFGSKISLNGAGTVVAVGAEDRNFSNPIKVFEFDGVLSTERFQDKDQLTYIYPNPARNNLTIKTNRELKDVKVYSTLGKSIKVPRTGNTLDISQLSSGSYLLKIYFDEKFEVKKLIII